MRYVLVLLCALPAIAGAQTISLLPPVHLAGGGASFVSGCCVVVADFNGDGKPDIAFNIEQPLPQGGVLLGNGDGTFSLPVPLSYPAFGTFTAGDFNGDGKPDLIFSSPYPGGQPTLYIGRGDGSFQSPVTVNGCTGALQVGDFNRDGKTDLICGTSLLLSNGDGRFSAKGTVGGQAMESVLLVADFNGDKVPDGLMLQISGRLAVILGHGDGTFGSELLLSYALKPQTTSGNFLAGDFNGDGKIDLVDFSLRGDSIDLLPGNGDGTFGPVVQTNIAANPYPSAMTAVGDFNKDGKLDFIAGDAIYAGNGDGTFRFPVFFAATAHACGPALSPQSGESCNVARGLTAVGDFNGDGLPDLVTYVVNKVGVGQVKDEGEVNVLLNDSPGNGFWTVGVNPVLSTWPVGSGSIVSAYGMNLAPSTAVAGVNPAPTTLGGIRVHVRDRSHTGDRLAPLLYVSPSQINYVLNCSDAFAFVDVERVGSPYVPQGMTVQIAPLAPAFFPAAYTTGAPGYLSLYGTGFAQGSAAGTTCTVGQVTVPVTYAGPEIVYAGLDQVNMLLPASLAGAGVQPVACAFGNYTSNTVNVMFR